jgi:hypothetical protein
MPFGNKSFSSIFMQNSGTKRLSANRGHNFSPEYKYKRYFISRLQCGFSFRKNQYGPLTGNLI